MVTLETTTGEYQLEVRNLDDPASGVDYDLVAPGLHAVLAHLDERVADLRKAAAESGQSTVCSFGDDPLN